MKGEEVIMSHWQELRKYACFNVYYNINVYVCDLIKLYQTEVVSSPSSMLNKAAIKLNTEVAAASGQNTKCWVWLLYTRHVVSL